jgi:ribose transport system substrate-binding protein
MYRVTSTFVNWRRGHRRSWVLASIAVAFVAAVAAGCGSSHSTSSGTAASGSSAANAPQSSSGGKPSVGYAESFLTDPAQVLLVKWTTQDAAKAGLNLLSPTNANGDSQQQVTNFTTLVAEHPRGIIAVPLDASAVIPGIKAANAANIPVVTLDTAVNGGKVYMTVRADNYEMGQVACQEMGKLLHGKGTVLELQGDLTSVNGLDRTNGFNNCIKKSFPGVTVVGKPTHWHQAEATAAAQTVLSTTHVDGVYIESDSSMGPGVWHVMQTLGRWHKVGQPDHVALVSIDGTPAALANVRSGYQDGLVSQPLNLYAQYAVEYIKEAIDGKTLAAGPSGHGSRIVTFHGNLEDLLPAPLVTASNVDDKTLWGNSAG